jgi:hypothetical protein
MARRLTPKMFVTSLIVFGLLLSSLWLKVIIYIRDDNPWGHENVYHLPVGTYLLLIMLIVVTPIFFILAWKERPNKWRRSN